MNRNSGFALAREWLIGIVLAFIVPLTTYYGFEVFCAYIVKTSDCHQTHLYFYLALIAGIIAIVLGNFFFNQYLSLMIGLSLGGLFTLIHGYIAYWSQFDLILKFISLLAILVLLLFIAIKRLKK